MRTVEFFFNSIFQFKISLVTATTRTTTPLASDYDLGSSSVTKDAQQPTESNYTLFGIYKSVVSNIREFYLLRDIFS